MSCLAIRSTSDRIESLALEGQSPKGDPSIEHDTVTFLFIRLASLENSSDKREKGVRASIEDLVFIHIHIQIDRRRYMYV